MAVPVVAIVGRPNVGKSSLFNWLAGRRIAIVDPTAGVTRDRVSTLVQVGDRFFELVDTGGMGIAGRRQPHRPTSSGRSRRPSTRPTSSSSSSMAGPASTPLDEEVARRLRHVDKPVICVANKCDTPELEPQAAEFYKLGRGKLICVSAQQNRGKDELLDLIRERLPPPEELDAAPKDAALKLAIVGRRNTGKSTFINSLAESERMIVSEVAAPRATASTSASSATARRSSPSTRPACASKKSMANDIEFYSLARAERSIRRADVVLLFLDAAGARSARWTSSWPTTSSSSTSRPSSSSTSGT